MPERERVLDWNDPQHLEVTTRVLPVAVPLGGRPRTLTWLGGRIFWRDHSAWYEHMHRRLKALARRALTHHEVGRVRGTLALGWDTALLEAAAERDLPIDVVLPFDGVQGRWELHHRQRFGRLLARAERRETVHGSYEPWTYAAAVRACLDGADLALALWDGEDDAVRRDLGRARTGGLEVVDLRASWERYGGLTDPGGGRAGGSASRAT